MPGMPHIPVGDAPTEPILLQALGPFLNPASTLLSILLLPSCYLSCHTGVSLSPQDGIIGCCCSLRAWFSQGSPQDWVGWDRLGMLATSPVSRTHSLPFCSVRHPPNQRLLDGTQAGKLSQALWLTAAPAASCFRAQHTNQMDPNSLPISHCSGMADLRWGKVRPDSVQAQHFPNPPHHPALLLPAWNFKVTQQVCWKEFVPFPPPPSEITTSHCLQDPSDFPEPAGRMSLRVLRAGLGPCKKPAGSGKRGLVRCR